MKKFLILAIILLFASVLFVRAQEDEFLTALKKCQPYSSNGILPNESQSLDVQGKILGWKNGKCICERTVKYSGMNIKRTCKFTQSQLDEIANAINFDKASNIDTSNIQAVQNSRTAQLLNKYTQDNSICTIDLN